MRWCWLVIRPRPSFARRSTTQQANSPTATTALPSIYFRNRPTGEDTPGEAWGNSQYDHVRFRAYRQANQTGPWIWYSRAENDLLRAEGLLRLGRANLLEGFACLFAPPAPLVSAIEKRHGRLHHAERFS